MTAKKGRKKPKKSAKKGRKKAKKGASHSTAKKGAARHSLKAGMIVTKKPNKRSLRAHKLHVQVAGTVNGKKAYKIVRNKKASARKLTAKSGYALAMRARAKDLEAKKAEEKALKAKWRAVIRLKARAEKLGLVDEADANAKLAASLQSKLNAKEAEVKVAKAEASAAKAEASSAKAAVPFVGIGRGSMDSDDEEPSAFGRFGF